MLREHEMQIRVRYSETDAMGLLHHANYFNFFEMGRTELLRMGGGSYKQIEEQGLFFVVVKLSCNYHLPARYDDVLTLHTSLANASHAKLEHDYKLFCNGQLITTAHSVLACVDRNGQPQRIPKLLENE